MKPHSIEDLSIVLSVGLCFVFFSGRIHLEHNLLYLVLPGFLGYSTVPIKDIKRTVPGWKTDRWTYHTRALPLLKQLNNNCHFSPKPCHLCAIT